MKFFFKSVFSVKSIIYDFWVIIIISFLFTFLLMFSTSMLSKLIDIDKLFVNPDIEINESFGDDIKTIRERSENLLSKDSVLYSDIVSKKFGILENSEFYSRVMLKEVENNYFNSARLKALNLNSIDTSAYKNPMVISKRFSNKYNIKIGDKIAFVTSANARARLFEVCCFYNTGLADFDDNIAFAIVSNFADDNLSIEIVSRFRPTFNVYSKNELRYIPFDDISDVVDIYKVKQGSDNENLFQSFNSIKFLLYIFSLIIIIYFIVAINNFNIRNKRKFEIFSILGEKNIWLYKLISSLLLTLISMSFGILFALLFLPFTPLILNFLSNSGILDLSYYVTNFNISIHKDLFVFLAIGIVSYITIYILQNCIKKALSRFKR